MIRKFFLLGSVFLLASSSAKAAIVFDFDMDLSTTGIQTTRTAIPGLTFDIGLMMSLTDPADVTKFDFNIGFNNQYVTINSVTIPMGRPTGYEQVTAPSIDNLGGIVGVFSGGPPVGPTLFAPPDSSFNLGILSITTMNVTGLDSTGVLLRFIDVGSDVFPSATFTSNASTLSVTAVPEPACVLLFAVMASSLALSRRRIKGIPKSFPSPQAASL